MLDGTRTGRFTIGNTAEILIGTMYGVYMLALGSRRAPVRLCSCLLDEANTQPHNMVHDNSTLNEMTKRHDSHVTTRMVSKTRNGIPTI